MLKLAQVIDKTALKYDVDVIVTPQYTGIKLLADNTVRTFQATELDIRAEIC